MHPERPPLRPAVLHILLALAEGELHGLGIADAVAAASEGVVSLGPGTLYRSLDEMRGMGLIEQVAAPSSDADPRRKYYRITAAGRGVLAAEVGRLGRLVEFARERDVLAEGA
ncbi:MAG: PadR family transcriptional regulator [Gemmatimonadota bacterium]|jgi:DNA-binding PadR family transcriptional regulator